MNPNFFIRLTISLLILVFFLSKSAEAQTDQTRLAPSLQGSSEANYYFATPGDLTILVNVWGYVNKAGRYEISTSTDLIQLLSLAGGPRDGAKLTKVMIVRVEKTESGTQKVEKMIDLEDVLNLDADDLKLQPGDTIYVDKTWWTGVKGGISFAASVAILVTAVTNLIIVLDR